MAFNLSTQRPKLIRAVGSFTELAVGMVTMVSGGATLDFAPALKRVDGAMGAVQGATGVGEDVNITDITGSIVTVETVNEAGNKAGTSVVMVIAWGTPKA